MIVKFKAQHKEGIIHIDRGNGWERLPQTNMKWGGISEDTDRTAYDVLAYMAPPSIVRRKYIKFAREVVSRWPYKDFEKEINIKNYIN